MNIPDEAVEAAAQALRNAFDHGVDGFEEQASAVLEAAASYLMAQAWEEGWEHARANYSALYTRREIPDWVTLRNPYYRSAGAGE